MIIAAERGFLDLLRACGFDFQSYVSQIAGRFPKSSIGVCRISKSLAIV